MKLIVFGLVSIAGLLAQPLPLAKPEQQGLSPARLERLHGHFQALVDKGQRSGVITLIARNGRIADWYTCGYRDVEAKLPMEKDTICRIYSMSKLITSAAVLQLLEEGRFELDDPVSQYLPEFKEMKVWEKGVLVPAKDPITIRHLLTHTAGFVYGGEGNEVEKLYAKAELFQKPTLAEFAKTLAGLPLVAQPGDRFYYGVNTDVLGYLVQVVSGKPFDEYVRDRIVTPLKMKDTGFKVPEAQQNRLAKIYTIKDGKLIVDPRPARGFPSGGGGLFSTIGDYARFAQMLLNGGELEGARVLGRKTVELMRADHLNYIVDPEKRVGPGTGFGLGVSVRTDAARPGILGSLGQYGWGGAASTYVRIDPQEKTIILLFMQHVPMDGRSTELFSNLTYQAIE